METIEVVIITSGWHQFGILCGGYWIKKIN